MKMTLYRLYLSLVALVFVPVAWGAPALTLTVDPSRVLPGIPPAFHVVVTNDSDDEVVLPEKVLLRVYPSNGVPFIAEWGASQEHRYSNARIFGPERRRVAAHATTDTWVRSYSLDQSLGWFYDARLGLPGTYRLQLLLLDDCREFSIAQALPVSVENFLPVRLVSSEAVLTVESPKGADENLWEQLQRMAKRHHMAAWSPMLYNDIGWPEFVRTAVEKYPGSAYAAFVARDYAEDSAGNRLTAEARIAKVRGVLQAQPQTPVRDSLRLYLAQTEVQAGDEAALPHHRDVQRAIDWYHRARTDLETLERTADDPSIRAQSAASRQRIPSDAQVKEIEREQ